MRKCKYRVSVNDKEWHKGLFHCWEQYSDIVNPGLTYGSTPGGQYSRTFALVEVPSGKILRVDSPNIIFTEGVTDEN